MNKRLTIDEINHIQEGTYFFTLHFQDGVIDSEGTVRIESVKGTKMVVCYGVNVCWEYGKFGEEQDSWISIFEN